MRDAAWLVGHVQSTLRDSRSHGRTRFGMNAIWVAVLLLAAVAQAADGNRPVNLAAQKELPAGKGLAAAFVGDAGVRTDITSSRCAPTRVCTVATSGADSEERA